MKYIFLTLALLLTVSFAFANSNENFSKSNLETVVFDDFTTSNYTFIFNDNQISQAELFAIEDCTLRGKFKITFSDGTFISWEGELTIVGQSCIDFLKKLMKKN